MFRAALHVLLGSSLLAGPASASPPASADEPAVTPTSETVEAGRNYEGVDAVEVSEAVVPEPPAEMEASPEPEAADPAPSAAPSPEPASEVEAAPAIEPEGPIDEDEDEDVPAYNPLVDSPEALRARSWVRSGAVLTAIGGVLVIGAIAMSTAKVNVLDEESGAMPCDPRQDRAGNGCLPEAKQRAVAAMAAPGALLLAGGVAMLVAGKVQQRRLRADLRASRRGVVLGVQVAF